MANRSTRDDFATQLFVDALGPIRKVVSQLNKPTVRSPLILLLILFVAGAVGYYVGYAQATTSELPIAIIHNVTITETYTKADPGATLPFGAREIDFLNTNHPDVEVFKDVDEGAKRNSADIFATAHNYAVNSYEHTSGKPVTLVVTGTRDPAKSQFRNVVLIESEP